MTRETVAAGLLVTNGGLSIAAFDSDEFIQSSTAAERQRLSTDISSVAATRDPVSNAAPEFGRCCRRPGAPLPSMQLPPLGTSHCSQRQILNPATRQYEWRNVCN
jgi:hypothetical protein